MAVSAHKAAGHALPPLGGCPGVHDWLRSAGVLRIGPSAVAEALAGFLGLELDEARLAEDPVVGLALEFSQC